MFFVPVKSETQTSFGAVPNLRVSGWCCCCCSFCSTYSPFRGSHVDNDCLKCSPQNNCGPIHVILYFMGHTYTASHPAAAGPFTAPRTRMSTKSNLPYQTYHVVGQLFNNSTPCEHPCFAFFFIPLHNERDDGTGRDEKEDQGGA